MPPAPRGRIIQVTDEVRLALGYHLGSVIQVSTPEGSVIIDSTGGTSNAANARDDLRLFGELDTKYLLYTHCHPDHCGGAEPLTIDTTEHIVAQALMPGLWYRDMVCIGPWHERIRSWQRGLPLEAGPPKLVSAKQNLAVFDDPDRSYLEPTLTFDTELDLELGGLTFHLEHTEGETRDHLLVWVPELGVLCPGDLYYASFPNLSTPAIGPRPIQGWIQSLERFMEFDVEHLVPSHTRPISGRDEVKEVLGNYRDAIAHIWDSSMQAMNDGLSVHQAARSITLPERLAALPYLAETYGTISWGVRAVYDQLTGWYDGDPANLDRLPVEHLDREVVALAGADAIVARAEALHAEGQHQLALELLSLVIGAEPGHERANRLQISVCGALIGEATSMNQRGFYWSGVRIAEARLAADDASGQEACPLLSRPDQRGLVTQNHR